MSFWGYAWIFISIVAIIAIIQSIKINKKKKEMWSRLKSIPDFNPTQQIMGCDGTSGIAVDESNKKICLIINRNASVLQRLIDYRDIISVELFEDGTSVTKTVRTSQIGGAVVGGLLLGGVGAIIGGMTGKSETSNKVKQIDLRIIVNDTDGPLHDITFMNIPSKKGSAIYNEAIRMARHWHSVLEILIKRADVEQKKLSDSENYSNPKISNISVADEIKKLAELEKAGILTSDEFQQQKIKLLSSKEY